VGTVSSLPALNASLNAAASVLLLVGYLLIRHKKVAAHRAAMVAALSVSTLFLASYLYYHYHVGSVRFTGVGWIRPVYFTILISHVVLAVTILPLALVTVTRALRADFARHRRIARITLPLWFYVSVTGVVIYWMLYGL
jgi:uncharacterized membrane protein YozB (DUF420 family)